MDAWDELADKALTIAAQSISVTQNNDNRGKRES